MNKLSKKNVFSSVIKFYSVTGEYGELSNFAGYSISLGGKRWPTSEHYFQAMKFESLKDQKEIQISKSPLEAARKGRDRKRKVRRNRESVKDKVMRDAVLAKFSQHAELTQLLVSTGDSKLVEHSDDDSYWGDGVTGRGRIC